MNLGDKLFNFKLPGTNGKQYTNFNFADRYALLLIVTSNHCQYSQSYWDRIKKLFAKYEEDNLGIIAISSNDATQQPEDSFEKMKELAESLDLHFPYVYDEEQEVARKLGAKVTPECFLFNSRRELVYKGAIDDAWENESMVMRVHLEDAIEYCLDGLDIDFPEVPAVGCEIIWKKGE